MERRQHEISLARQASAGDPTALADLTHLLRQRLARYSRMVCRQPEDAEEVVQETLIQVFQKIGDLREPEVIHAWVFRIAFNHCRMKRRRGVHEPEAIVALDDGGELRCPGGTPEELLLESESAGAMDEAIAALPEDFRCVVMLRCLEGLSTEETAGILGATPDIVRARLCRARAALRRRLALADS